MAATAFHLSETFPAVTRDAWVAQTEKDLKGVPFAKLVTKTYEGIDLQPLYTRADLPAGDYAGLPGARPWLRGVRASGVNPCSWDIRQPVAQGDATSAATAVAEELARGAHAVELRLTAGFAPRDAAEMGRVLAAVDWTRHGVGLDAGPATIAAAAGLVQAWRAAGIQDARAVAAFNADPLSLLASHGAVASGTPVALAEAMDLLAWTRRHAPRCQALRISSAPWYEAGADAVTELACTLAAGVAYLRAAEQAGVSPADVDAGGVLALAIGCEQFLEIAKLRAGRALWARVLAACGVARPQFLLQAISGRRIQTAYDPWVNLLRTTVAGFAAAVANADRVTLDGFDACLGASDALGRRIARNTQIILAEESHLDQVVDPAGGSWYVETLTRQLCERAWARFQEIEAKGGLLAALADGSIAGWISAIADERRKALARRKDPITGVSEFPHVGEELPRRPALAPAWQPASPLSLPPAGSGVRFTAAVAAVAQGAPLAALLPAQPAAGAAALAPWRFAAGYESLRAACDARIAAGGTRPTAFLANLGPIAVHTARAGFAKNFLEAGGIAAPGNDGFADPVAAAAAFRSSGTRLAVVCSSDEVYATHAEAAAAALRAAGATAIVLAGNPGERKAALQAAGYTHFIHIGCDVLATLRALLAEEGIR
jgi:methylmalonyl-CoA mutase